ncbi:MAG: glycosyltransferase [Pseudonocardiaceae bacterium]|nr:glycosyltransferase [Pseudonocardiaceae bacterium]
MTIALAQEVPAYGRYRILLGADTFAPDVNGAARFAERLAAGLAERGHEVHVVCPSTDAVSREEQFRGVTVHRVASHRTPVHPSFRICLPWQARRAVSRVIDEIRPDVVHPQAHFLVGRALVRAAGARRIPIVATNHFMPENLLGYVPLPRAFAAKAVRWAWRDLGNIYGKADVLTAPTPLAVKLLQDNGLGYRARAVSCGIDAGRYAGNGATVPGTILFVGRLDAEKRVNEILEAAAKLVNVLPVRVEIVGDGSCRAELTELARTLGIADSVTFHGFVSETELLAAYARAEVFCMPGVAELQSLATMEAMAAGKPVVAADAVALPHLVREGQNGWLFPPGDVDTLAARLRMVLGGPGVSTKFGAESTRLIAGHALTATLERFEDIYAEVTGARVARPHLARAAA